jgi:uncharacterized protein (TIGR02271 family)
MTATTTVVGLFDDFESANKAVSQLERAGIQRDHISVVAGNESGQYQDYVSGSGEVGKGIAGGAGAGAAIGGGLGLVAGLMALAIPGFGPVIAAGPIAAALTGAGIGAAAGGLIGGLTKAGVSETDAEYYAEGVRRGGVLLTVRTTERLADEAADILDDAGATDVEEKSQTWRSSGWQPKTTGTFGSGYIPTRGYDEQQIADRDRITTAKGERKHNLEGDRKLEAVEEELQVGKREVGRKGVRVYSEVSQRPVEEQIRLRDEKVVVDRQKVNRPAKAGDLEAFKEGQVELTETHEEPVVSKTARVVEEVRVGKEVNEHTETIRDNVRRKDVRVEETGGTSNYDKDFRTDYQTRYGTTGRDYNYYAPGYQFGSTYANESRYRDRDWSVVEPELRRDWETRGHGKWEDFKDSIRYGWDRVRGRR